MENDMPNEKMYYLNSDCTYGDMLYYPCQMDAYNHIKTYMPNLYYKIERY